AIRINQKGDLLEREKGDAKRQQDLCKEQIGPEESVEVVHKEIRVFKVTEHADVHDNSERQQSARSSSMMSITRDDTRRDGEVDQHERHKQQKIHRIPPAVKEKREQGQCQYGSSLLTSATQSVIDQQR